ncbi:ABC transporter permease [Ornithinimicrobium faecis]|uniref:ABC transporter permease n=1 Tax=Ornithinimicrobium faecis TaxID=2934158 RepID=A0ABY4YUQ0_9MICO|nr:MULTISPECIES: ABC transporter permease [unclassified Ornithinimicrobium]USQ80501.1 ABC transporter permease [Ornithinimicrobium sp. HY1793]
MIGYSIRRTLYGLLVLLMVTTFVFVVLRLIPGDVVRLQLADAPGVTQAQVDALAAELGLDQPVFTQFFSFMSGALTGDLGTSFETRLPVTEMIVERLPATLELGALAIIFSVLLGVPLGVISAMRSNSVLDQSLRLVSVAGISVPNFWLALLLITYLSIWFGWSQPLVYATPWQDLSTNLSIMIIPALALGTSAMAAVSRMLRSSMLEVTQSNFVRTVRSRGASEGLVILKHAGRNSILPVFTLLGLQVGHILGGTVILESIFSIPGMGSLIFTSVQMRDYPVVLGCVIFYGAVFILVNLLVDLVYAVIDPRIRYS